MGKEPIKTEGTDKIINESNNIDDFPKFKNLEIDSAALKLIEFFKYYNKVLKTLGIKSEDIIFSRKDIFTIFQLIEKRRIYFKIFYGSKLGEFNISALTCFWILKIHPFRHKDKKESSLINTQIAYYFFIESLYSHIKYINKKFKTNKKLNITYKIANNLFYSFHYRDLSKEALMSLTDSLIYEEKLDCEVELKNNNIDQQ